jgi:hypothetical protein
MRKVKVNPREEVVAARHRGQHRASKACVGAVVNLNVVALDVCASTLSSGHVAPCPFAASRGSEPGAPHAFYRSDRTRARRYGGTRGCEATRR